MTKNGQHAAPTEDDSWHDVPAQHAGQQISIRVPKGYMLATTAELAAFMKKLEETESKNRENVRNLARLAAEVTTSNDEARVVAMRNTELVDQITLLGMTIARYEAMVQHHKRRRRDERDLNRQLRRCLSRPFRWLVDALMNRAIYTENKARHADALRMMQEAKDAEQTKSDLNEVLRRADKPHDDLPDGANRNILLH